MTELGAYVLGALDPAGRARLERHLQTCRHCRAELARLAGLPGLLRRVGVDVLEVQDDPPPRMLEDLLVRVAAEREAAPAAMPARPRPRRPSRRQWLLVAASAAVLAVAGLTIGQVVDREPASTTISAIDPTTDVRLDVTLRTTAQGTEVAVRVSGVPAGEWCRLVVVADDGREEVAGTWRATYQGTAEIIGATSIPVAELSAVRVVGADGQLLAVART